MSEVVPCSGLGSFRLGSAILLGLAPLLGLAVAREPDRPAPLDCTGKDGVCAADVRKAQEAWAEYLGRKVEETIEVADGVKMTFVLVPPGTFLMGSPADEQGRGEDETPHEVTLTEPFDLGKTEVTQAQYQALAGKNPSLLKGADLPVECVSWEEARDWAEKLTKKLGGKRVYRLPTEAEWEYACRGGRPSSLPFGVGDGHALSARDANFNGNFPAGNAARGIYLESTCAVGSYPANAFGLHDMHGNVLEWCRDWYGSYPHGAMTNPTGSDEKASRVFGERDYRVFRGGCWQEYGVHCRAASRSKDWPERRQVYIGFRAVRAIR